ncbi:MAG: hypothetical protein J7K13_07130 [Thermoplasmata archaeon]|nr:hypothetical protein [Thermoplasmata archaeon]
MRFIEDELRKLAELLGSMSIDTWIDLQNTLFGVKYRKCYLRRVFKSFFKLEVGDVFENHPKDLLICIDIWKEYDECDIYIDDPAFGKITLSEEHKRYIKENVEELYRYLLSEMLVLI